ncbi:MAG: DUF1501 domain-containing protein [Rhodospirillaceae bacterium]|nr:DUF1501 domain-containing protein [Rhodospirillaceae bacterium]
MTINSTSSRRTFLRNAGAGIAAGAVTRLTMMNALAQTAPDYKALVCIFLMGGNDGHNTLIPQDTAGFAAYRAARGALALPDGNTPLVQIAAKDGRPFAFNGGLSAVAPLWGQGKLAAVANVGMLVQPTTRQQYMANSVTLPSNLFSHADQVIAMQAGNPFGSGGTGWAGRIADAVQSLNGAAAFPTAFSMNGASLFCTGNAIQSASLYPGFDLSLNGLSTWPTTGPQPRAQALQEILTFDSGLAMVQAADKVNLDARALNQMLRSAGTSQALATTFPGTNLGLQLRQIADIIKLRSTTGMSRQVFFASIGGFDTHSSQSWQHWDLLRQVSEAMLAFYNATAEMGIADKVTTFTESDFGRTLQPSGNGSDHGWGSHHLVMGGGVKGGDIYGTFPTLALGGPDDTNLRGVLIPTTSIDQYGATMAKWFGVGPAAMTQVFPNLGNFPVSDLGFLG